MWEPKIFWYYVAGSYIGYASTNPLFQNKSLAEDSRLRQRLDKTDPHAIYLTGVLVKVRRIGRDVR
jgi:hypothetical protein